MKYAIQHIPSGQYLYAVNSEPQELFSGHCLFYSEDDVKRFSATPVELILFTTPHGVMKKLRQIYKQEYITCINNMQLNFTDNFHEFTLVPTNAAPILQNV